MRYFRHGPLTYYTLVVLLAGAIIVSALLGGHPGRQPVRYGVSVDRVTVLSVATRMGELKVLEATNGPVSVWATSVAAIAQRAATSRANAYGPRDPIAHAWSRLAHDARALAHGPASAVLALGYRVESDVVWIEELVGLPSSARAQTPPL